MPAAARTIEIAASIIDVFAFFTDPENDTRWRAAVQVIHADGPPAVGKTVRQVVVFGSNRRLIDADIRITEYIVPTRYAFETVNGPIHAMGGYTFEVAGAGGSSVTFMLDAQLRGLKRLFLGASVQTAMDAEMAAMDRAKALLEDQSDP